jgi:hypothetical protein
MKNLIEYALYANAATLGIHWIYNQEFLLEESKKASLFFRVQDPSFFAQAGKAYYAYPLSGIGDVTGQGVILAYLYQAMKNNPELNQDQYKQLLLHHFLPGGDYIGYVETYMHKLIFNYTIDYLKISSTPVSMDDDHLIGFVPYLVVKQLGLPTSKAWELAQLFTNKQEYLDCYYMFDYIFDHLKGSSIQDVLKEAIKLGPKRYQVQFIKALEMTDTQAFVKDYAGTACAINMSVPIIIHLLNNSRSFDEMLLNNALISGAISERGMMLAALFHDCVYDPMSGDNEEKSAQFFMECVIDKSNPDLLEVKQMILDTKTHQATTNLSEKFNQLDMNIVERDFNQLLEWETGIYNEYKAFGEKYKEGRLKFLESLLDKYPKNTENLLKLVDWVKENY